MSMEFVKLAQTTDMQTMIEQDAYQVVGWLIKILQYKIEVESNVFLIRYSFKQLVYVHLVLITWYQYQTQNVDTQTNNVHITK